MARIIENIVLSPDRDSIYGWEMKKSFLTVSAMREGVKLRHVFPDVDVVRINDGIYQLLVRGGLVTPENYGGHNRVLSHILEGVSFGCNLWGGHLVEVEGYVNFRSIRGIRFSGEADPISFSEALSYLPEDVAMGFCERYGVDFDRYYNSVYCGRRSLTEHNGWWDE